MDVILAMKKAGSYFARPGYDKIVRSYDHPDRFIGPAGLINVLKDLKNQRYVQVIVHDSETQEEKVWEFENVNNSSRIEKLEREIHRENVKRCKRRFEAMKASGSNPDLVQSVEEKVEAVSGEIEQLEKIFPELILGAHQRALAASSGDEEPDFTERELLKREYRDKKRELEWKSWEPMYEAVGGWDAFQAYGLKIVNITDQAIVKFIYATSAEEQVIMDREGYRVRRASSTCHSELNQGRNGYGLGEVAFKKHDQIFQSFDDWREWAGQFDFSGPWIFYEVNNASGHYRPANQMLPYTKNLLLAELNEIGYDPELLSIPEGGPKCIDALLRGAALSEIGVFEGSSFSV